MSESSPSLVDPLDYKILGCLPEEGTLFAGAYPETVKVKAISRDAFALQLRGDAIGKRLSMMTKMGLVVAHENLPGMNGDRSYQRTAEGKRVYEEWKKAQS